MTAADEARLDTVAVHGAVCSRCGAKLPHFEPAAEMTAGYYVAAAWCKFTNPGETYVCDRCMWSDQRYIAVYGEVE